MGNNKQTGTITKFRTGNKAESVRVQAGDFSFQTKISTDSF